MKRDLSNNCRQPMNKQPTLWKKIGIVPKLSNEQIKQDSEPTLQTSLQLQMMNQQKQFKSNDKCSTKQHCKQISTKEQLKTFRKQGKIDKNWFCPNQVKMVESICNSGSLQQDDHNIRNLLCQRCLPKTQQFFYKLKQQIKIIFTDYKVTKQQIIQQMNNFRVEIVKQSKAIRVQGQLKNLDFATIQHKFKHKEEREKLQWINIQKQKRKKLITDLQIENKRLKNQIMMLERFYLSFLNSFELMEQKRVKSTNENFHKEYTVNSQVDLSSQVSQKSPQRVNRSDKDKILDNISVESSEIQNIKMKLQGLKLRLNRTTSNNSYYC